MKNSSCSFNAKSSCCIGGRPPSPDGEPPRQLESLQLSVPTERPKLSGRLFSKHHVPTWRTVEGTELQAIFENEVDDEVDRFRDARHKGSTQFREMLALSDPSDSDKDSVQIKSKMSSSALQVVSKKLKKHLSKDLTVNKRHSRSSVGTSEEEVERRAELRRIRQLRIQEELELEGIRPDDDANSISSMITSPSLPPTARQTHQSWTPGSFVPPPLLMPPVLQLPKLSFPHLSPLEKRNDPFPDGLVTESSTTCLTPRRWSNPESSITLFHTSGSLSRRHSSPLLSPVEATKSELQQYISSRQSSPGSLFVANGTNSKLQPYIASRQSSLSITLPPAPTLQATRLPSFALPARSSWRLSFSGDDRGHTLRKLSHGHAIPITLDTELLRSRSPPPNRGLHNPGLRLSSQVILSSDDAGPIDYPASHLQTCSAERAYGGVDGASTTHLHELAISQRLAPRSLQRSSSSPQLSADDSTCLGFGSLTDIQSERTRFMQMSTESATLSELIPPSWGQVKSRQGSSIYHSINNSPQVSRQSSRFNLLSLFSGSRNKISAAEYQELIPPSFQLSQFGTPSNVSRASLTIPLTNHPHRSNIDDSSLLASETSSFRERETELSAVQARFASVEARRVQSTPVSSKFREEFSSEVEDAPVQQQAQQRKSSTFSKLSKLAIRTYDGAKLEELLDIPIPKFDPKGKGPPTSLLSPLAPYQDDDAVNVWGKVLRKPSSGDRSQDGADYFTKPRKKSSLAPRKKSALEEEIPVSLLGNLTHLGKGKKKQGSSTGQSKSAAEEYQERFQERLAVKELALDSWEEEMAASAARAQARSRNIVKKNKPTGPDRRYPATWSRFPSHTRSERVHGGVVNSVEVKDFAVLGHKTDGEIIWCLEHDDDGHHAEIEGMHEGIRQKVKERVRHKAYKVDTAHRQAFQTSGRRGSLTIANELEYPELEILPLTFLTGEQMEARHEEEAQVAEEKAKDEELDDLIGLFGGRDGTCDAGSIIVAHGGMSSSNTEPDLGDRRTRQTEVDGADADANATFGDSSGKFKTWNGKDFDGYWYEGKRISLASMLFKKSSAESVSGVEEMESTDKEKVLKAVKNAWARG